MFVSPTKAKFLVDVHILHWGKNLKLDSATTPLENLVDGLPADCPDHLSRGRPDPLARSPNLLHTLVLGGAPVISGLITTTDEWNLLAEVRMFDHSGNECFRDILKTWVRQIDLEEPQAVGHVCDLVAASIATILGCSAQQP